MLVPTDIVLLLFFVFPNFDRSNDILPKIFIFSFTALNLIKEIIFYFFVRYILHKFVKKNPKTFCLFDQSCQRLLLNFFN